MQYILTSFTISYWLLLLWGSSLASFISSTLLLTPSFWLAISINAVCTIVIIHVGYQVVNNTFNRKRDDIVLHPTAATFVLFIICLFVSYGGFCEIVNILASYSVPYLFNIILSVFISMAFMLFTFVNVHHNFKDATSSLDQHASYLHTFINVTLSSILSISTALCCFWLLSYAFLGHAIMCPFNLPISLYIGVLAFRFTIAFIPRLNAAQKAYTELNRSMLLYSFIITVFQSIDVIVNDLLLVLHVCAEAGVQTHGIVNDTKSRLLNAVIPSKFARSLTMMSVCSTSEFLFDMTEASDDYNPCVLSPSEQIHKNILTLRLILNVFILFEHMNMGVMLIGLSSVIKPNHSLSRNTIFSYICCIIMPYIITITALWMYPTFSIAQVLYLLGITLLSIKLFSNSPKQGFTHQLSHLYSMLPTKHQIMVGVFALILAVIGSFELVEAFAMPLPMVAIFTMAGLLIEYSVYDALCHDPQIDTSKNKYFAASSFHSNAIESIEPHHSHNESQAILSGTIKLFV